MKPPKENLQQSVTHQREALMGLLREPLGRLAEQCVPVWGDRNGLNAAFGEALKGLPYCKHLYALNVNAIQISDNVGHDGLMEGYGRDRSKRPYLQEAVPGTELLLSDAYISLKER